MNDPDQRETCDEFRQSIGEVTQQISDNRRELRKIADSLRLKAENSTSPDALELYLLALDGLGVDDVTHPDVMSLTRVHKRESLPHVDSFWRSILMRRRRKQLGTVPEKRLGVGKIADMEFARRAGSQVVETQYRGKFSTAPRELSPTVLKPVQSSDSLGAFYLFADDKFSISRSESVESWSEIETLGREDLGVDNLDSLDWELQSMVTWRGKPAPDLKFYCFYGVIGAVLEVNRYPTQHYAYFDGDLHDISFRVDPKPGFDDLGSTAVRQGGVGAADLKIVSDLSKQIPVPFMRLDYLLSDDGLVFCEFSSAPGNSHSLTSLQDERLGQLYLEAENRLGADLLDGKVFAAFREFSNLIQEDNGISQPQDDSETEASAADVDYKISLKRGRELFKLGQLDEAEKELVSSLDIRFTPWAVNSLGRLYVHLNKLEQLHNLEDRAIHEFGDKWERPDYFPKRRLTDRQKAAANQPLISSLPDGVKDGAQWARQKVLPGEKLRIADREGYRITYHRAATDADVLLVAFGAANSFMSDIGFGTDYALAMGYDCIYVAQKAETDYQELPLDEFHQAVAPFAQLYSRVVAYGSSLGAYSALYFGGSIGAKIIASAPRIPNHPVYGYKQFRGRIFRHADLPNAPKSDLAPVVLVDPSLDFDTVYIHEVVQSLYDDIELVEVPYAGHAVLMALREARVLKPFISAIVENDPLPVIEWGGPGNATWHRERGHRAVERRDWHAAEIELQESLDLQFTTKAARLLAITYHRSDQREKLLDLVDLIERECGNIEFLPAEVSRSLSA